MNYVSPPIEQYLKFKNHCSLVPSHPHFTHNKRPSILTACTTNGRPPSLHAQQAAVHPHCMQNKRPAILSASTQALNHSHESAQPSSLRAQQELSHTQCMNNKRRSILIACTTSARLSSLHASEQNSTFISCTLAGHHSHCRHVSQRSYSRDTLEQHPSLHALMYALCTYLCKRIFTGMEARIYS